MLLKTKKSNKLSTNFRPSAFKVAQKTGTEVTVRNEAGEELIRNNAFVKKYNEQDGVSRPKGKENSWSKEVGQRQKVVPPTVTGVCGNSLVPLQNTPEKG